MLRSLINRQGAGSLPAPSAPGVSALVAIAAGGCAARMVLPDPVRRRLGSFSRTVFSDSNRTGPERRGSGGILDNEIVSSLPLQMSLYFNLYFFPFWWVSSVVMLQLKYPVLPDYYKFILVTVIVLASLIEAIRLYLGYMGNLQEKVEGQSLLYIEGIESMFLCRSMWQKSNCPFQRPTRTAGHHRPTGDWRVTSDKASFGSWSQAVSWK
ncbi:transmembrane protein 17 isoform X4 [Chrysemys picta bellii]|uniref:transmembrane protein 17 isoform X4 n=1 Tax=Chrysemys picta bellii TaxID=8478 RepID=UPI0032B22B02